MRSRRPAFVVVSIATAALACGTVLEQVRTPPSAPDAGGVVIGAEGGADPPNGPAPPAETGFCGGTDGGLCCTFDVGVDDEERLATCGLKNVSDAGTKSVASDASAPWAMRAELFADGRSSAMERLGIAAMSHVECRFKIMLESIGSAPVRIMRLENKEQLTVGITAAMPISTTNEATLSVEGGGKIGTARLGEWREIHVSIAPADSSPTYRVEASATDRAPEPEPPPGGVGNQSPRPLGSIDVRFGPVSLGDIEPMAIHYDDVRCTFE